jgi:hypothetical protein
LNSAVRLMERSKSGFSEHWLMATRTAADQNRPKIGFEREFAAAPPNTRILANPRQYLRKTAVREQHHDGDYEKEMRLDAQRHF